MSTKSQRAPACDIASVVAMNVFGTVTTMSPDRIPAAMSANRKASVPLPTPTQNRDSQNLAKSSSNPCTIGPPINAAVLSAVLRMSTNSSCSPRWTVTRSRKGTFSSLMFVSRFKVTYYFPWVADHDRVRRHVASHHTAGADQRIFADHHIRQDGRSRSNRRTLLYQRDFDLPILFCLESTCPARRTWEGVIDERDVVSDKDLVLDRDPFTDECMARYFAPPADFGILLNLDKRPDFRLITDLATVEVDELGKRHVVPHLDIRRNAAMAAGLHHAAIRS